jgi:hypothetical protein
LRQRGLPWRAASTSAMAPPKNMNAMAIGSLCLSAFHLHCKHRYLQRTLKIAPGPVEKLA